MREPVKVLKSLSEKTTKKEYKFKRLYRNLYNPEFYFLAYKNISQSQGSMTPGVDGKSLDGMSEKRINALIESLKDFSYQPNPARRVYIEKKNSTKKRPLGIPSTEDKLVQDVRRHIVGGANRRLISAIVPPRLHSPVGDCTLLPVQPQAVVGLFEEQNAAFETRL